MRKIPCFSLSVPETSFGERRMIFKEGGKEGERYVELGGGGGTIPDETPKDVSEARKMALLGKAFYKPKEPQKPPEEPKKPDVAKAKEGEKKELEKKPEKAEEEGKEGKKLSRLKRRVSDPFDGSDEEFRNLKLNERKAKEREKYVNLLREAIGKDPDKWYKFVQDHKVYNGGLEWNKDLCENVLGVPNLDPKIQRKYAAGLQVFLTEELAKHTPPVVLEDKPNSFTRTDGMIGGYYMSALGVYLNSDLYETPKPADWKQEFVTLGDQIKNPRTREKYDQAIQYLKDQLAGKPVAVAGAEKPEKPVKLKKLHENFVPYYKTYTTFLKNTFGDQAKLVNVDSNKFKNAFDTCVRYIKESAFKDSEPNTFDLNTWRQMAEEAQVMETVMPDILFGPPAAKEAKKTEEPAKAPAKGPKIEVKKGEAKIEALDPGIEKQVPDLIKIVCSYGFEKRDQINLISKSQINNYTTLVDERGRNPSGMAFNQIPGSWPDKAFQEYKALYDKKGPDDKDVLSAFSLLKKAIGTYPVEMKQAIKDTQEVYNKKLRNFLLDHDLSKGINILVLSPTITKTTMTGTSIPVDNPLYVSLESKIPYRQYRNPKNIDNLFKDYFNEAPSHTFKTWQEVRSSAKEPTNLEIVLGQKGEDAMLFAINSIIELRNVYKTNDFLKNLITAHNNDLNSKIATLNGQYESALKSSSNPTLVAAK